MFRVFASALPPGLDAKNNLRDMRHHKFENYREGEQAAFFARALKAAGLKHNLEYAHYPGKEKDFDAVLRWDENGSQEYAYVQLKEVVPEKLSPAATLQDAIGKFKRYSNPEDLIGVVFINRSLTFNPSDLDTRSLKLRELWIHGVATGNGEERHGLYGDFMAPPIKTYDLQLPNLRWDSENLPWRRPLAK
jgi:hypothetical protein